MELGPDFRGPMSRPRCRRGEFEDRMPKDLWNNDAVTKRVDGGPKSNVVIDCARILTCTDRLTDRLLPNLGTVKVRTDRTRGCGLEPRTFFGSQIGPKLENCGAVGARKKKDAGPQSECVSLAHSHGDPVSKHRATKMLNGSGIRIFTGALLPRGILIRLVYGRNFSSS